METLQSVPISYFSAMKLIVFFIGVFLLATACNKVVEDKTKPVMESLSMNGDEFKPQDVIEIYVGLSDNENLSQVRSRISPSFAKTFGDWKDVSVKEISGTRYEGTISFTVPDTATAGYYQVTTRGSDMRGNGTVDSVMYFTILQPGFAPEIIDFETKPPIVNGVLYMTATDSLTFAGVVIDDTGLKNISINLKSTEDKNIKSLSYNIADSSVTWDFALQGDTILPDYEAVWPGLLLIKALDIDGNQTRREVPIEFEP